MRKSLAYHACTGEIELSASPASESSINQAKELTLKIINKI